MYANLFNRDMRKILITESSSCTKCKSVDKLQLDHIISISKGGKNEISNLQILCCKCNNNKSNND
ncbi:HNH endonuclease [Chryseobacterium manosquense]|uniref:HNH endonuclease n=2 Tax=Chryseobacterium manosquense TaxID=2754694 RepID=A0A7H1E0G0_9FLAO|nr:HNH endonuclease [Chryseobacterium manosquense]